MKRYLFAVFCLVLTTYLTTLSCVLSFGDIGIDLLNKTNEIIKVGSTAPSLYLFMQSQWMTVLNWTALSIDPALWMASLNALISAATLTAIAYFCLRRFEVSKELCTLTVCLIASTYTVWMQSISLSPFWASMLWIVMALCLLCQDTVSQNDWIRIGALQGIAMAMDMTHLFFVTGLLYSLYKRKHMTPLQKLQALALYSVSLIVTLGILYAITLAGAVSLTAVFAAIGADLMAMIYGIATPVLTGAVTVKKLLLATFNALLGGHFIWALPGGEELLSLPKISGVESYRFMVKDMPKSQALSILLATLLYAALGIVVIIKLLWERAWQSTPTIHKTLLFLLCIYTIASIDSVHPMLGAASPMPWLCLVLLLSSGINDLKRWQGIRLRRPLAIIAILSLLINYFGGIYYALDKQNDIHYAQIAPIIKKSKAGDLILLGNDRYIRHYLKQNSHAQVIDLKQMQDATPQNKRRFQQSLSTLMHDVHRTHSIFIDKTAIDSKASKEAREIFVLYQNKWAVEKQKYSHFIWIPGRS